MPWALGGVCVLFLIALGLAIYFATDTGSSSSNSNGSSSSSSSDTGVPLTNNTCLTESCVSLADAILSSIDDTVDPCEDFFQFSCGNWQDDNDWELIEYSAYNQFYALTFSEMHTFLDAIYYDTDDSLIDHTSVQKAIDFYSSCYDSTVEMEEVEESTVLQEFLEQVQFSDDTSDTWDSDSRSGFIDVVAWLSIRGWNNFFVVTTIGDNWPWIYQNYENWLYYNSTQYRQVLIDSYAPVYEELYGINATEAVVMAEEVADLADSIYSVSTATTSWSDLTYMLTHEAKIGAFSNMSSIFGNSQLLNMTSLLIKTFDYSGFDEIVYYKQTPAFIENLASILEAASPQVVQYYLVADILTNFVNFQDTYEQSRSENRVTFCYAQTLNYFPFIYGYILYHETYNDTKYNDIYNMVTNISTNGIKVGINDATWIEDDSSLNASLKKIEYLGIYVGLPPKITESDELDNYYTDVSTSTDDFVGNIGNLVDFVVYTTQATISNTIYDLISPWPSIFKDPSTYGSWLTGINAFYVPTGNYFTIPITISGKPYYDIDYPSAIKFGGLGSVIGHEISHGFDPSGSYYNYNGTEGDIWSNATRSAYESNMECFITQYDGIEVDGVYVNGSETITENVADNGGNSASYYAWKTYISNYGDDFDLPGVGLTSEQLFFWAWANAWCEDARPGYYDDWNDVHSPAIARVWGVVQNSQAFANAYNCSANTKMNPTDKCILW